MSLLQKLFITSFQLFVHCRCNVISCYFYCYKYFQFFFFNWLSFSELLQIRLGSPKENLRNVGDNSGRFLQADCLPVAPSSTVSKQWSKHKALTPTTKNYLLNRILSWIHQLLTERTMQFYTVSLDASTHSTSDEEDKITYFIASNETRRAVSAFCLCCYVHGVCWKKQDI